MTDAAPLLGIFWAVTGPDRRAHLLTRPCSLAGAEEYDACLTSPDGHYETWETWRCGRLTLPLPALAPVIAVTEYETWPRGRIVFDHTAGKFIIYADRQLLNPPALTRIREEFRLPAAQTVSRTDSHYRNTRRVAPIHDGAP